MAGDLRISMLIEANAARAKAEVVSLREETAGLGRAGETAGGGLKAVTDSTAEWGSVVQMLRASMQPMVAEANALAAAADQLATAEEAGAINAREAALAHDLLARAAMDLQARMDAAGVTLDGTTAALTRHETAVQQLIARTTGLSSATGESIADHLRHGQALDALRARFNPLFAASRQYELALEEIAEAERLGAISALEAAAARERAAQAMAPIPAQLERMGRSSQSAAMYAGQLGYQLNDIGMMLSMGQSPFLLMMQQGPQVAQVFGDMRRQGLALGPALASAFTGLLNPVSLATMAVIGFGAAAVQYFGQASDAAETAADAISRLDEIRSGLAAAQDIESLSLTKLIEKYGLYAFQIRDGAKALAELHLAEAKAALSEGVETASDDIDRYAARTDAAAAMRARRLDAGLAATRQAVINLQKDLGLTEDEAIRLADAFRDVQAAASLSDRVTAMQELQAEIRAAGISLESLPGPIRAALIETNEVTISMGELRGQIDGGTQGLLQMLAAAPAGGWLAGAIGDAATLASTLWDAASAAAAAARQRAAAQDRLAEMDFEFSAGGQALMRYGSRAPAATPAQRALASRYAPDPEISRGGSGGGAARDERDALAELIAEQERQIALLRTTDPVQQEILRNHEALAEATDSERAEVERLITERQRLEEIRDQIDEIGAAGEQAFKGLVTRAHSFGDAIDIIAQKLQDMMLSDFWDMIWSGMGGGGGLSGLFSGFLGLGGGGGGGAGTGSLGLPMPFADGGRVSGPGGPRDDAVAAWLSDGEYVVNAATTARYLPFLEALNRGASLSDLSAWMIGTRAPAFADGGLARLNGASAPSEWRQAGVGGGMAPGGLSLVQTFEDHTSGGVSMRTEETSGPGGQKQQRIIMSDAVAEGLSVPGGAGGRAPEALFGLRRAPRRRGG